MVQTVDFVSDDPAFAGTMTMTWAVHAVDGGTLVEFVADGVSVGDEWDTVRLACCIALYNALYCTDG